MGSANSVGNYLNRRFCVFREFCGKLSQQKVLCKSVKSVGVFLSRKFCVFCEICGRFSQLKVLCIPRILWEIIISRRFCGFRKFCGRFSLWVRGYGKDAIPSYNTSVGQRTLYKPDQTLGLNVFSTCASTSSGRLQKKSMPVRASSSLIEMACEPNVSFVRHAFVCSLQNAMPA